MEFEFSIEHLNKSSIETQGSILPALRAELLQKSDLDAAEYKNPQASKRSPGLKSQIGLLKGVSRRIQKSSKNPETIQRYKVHAWGWLVGQKIRDVGKENQNG